MQRIAVIAVASLAIAGAACAQFKSPSPTPAPSATAPPAVLTQQAEPPLESAKRIERAEAIKMVDSKKAVFVDVRPKDAYEQGHIKGSINIPLSDLIARIKDLPPHKYIITYCA
jgi:3-mercaptopyruvate sulfurtransferase SseA